MQPQLSAMPTALSEALTSPQLRRFCQRWRIEELCLFGSALREDFGPASDVDLLATFSPTATWTLLDAIAMEQELAELLGRKVDLVTRRSVERAANSLLRREILSSAKVVYAVA